MTNYNNGSYDFRTNGDRRTAERRKKASGRRGILRWDPATKDRRTGKDRRKESALTPGR